MSGASYSQGVTASASPADALHDKPRRRYPPVTPSWLDAEAQRLLTAYYRAMWARARMLTNPLAPDLDREGRELLDADRRHCWQLARDLQDPTWWRRQLGAPRDDEEST